MIASVTQYFREKFLNISIGWALCVILLLGLVPAGVMGKFFVAGALQNIEIVDKELSGLEYLNHIKPIDDFITDMPDDHVEREEKAKQYWQLLQTSSDHDEHAGQFNSSKHVKAVLDKLRLVMNGEDVDPRPSFDALISRLGDQSGLILDPELDSYYLMEIVLIKSRRLARAAEELERVHPMTSGAKDPLLLISRHRVADAARDLQSAMVYAVEGNRDGTLERSNLIPTINETIKQANNLVQGNNISADHIALSSANQKSWQAASASLGRVLNSRRDRINSELMTGLTICGVVIVIVLLLAGIVIATLTGGLKRISERVEDLSQGDVWSPVPGAEFNNDIGVIANALQEFIYLSGQVDNERAEARSELESTVQQVRLENKHLLAQALEQQEQSQKFERQAIEKLAAELETQVSELLTGSRTAASQMDVEASAMAHSTSGVQREAAAAAIAANDIKRSVQAVGPLVGAVSKQLDEYTVSLGEAKTLAADAVTRVDNAKRRVADFNEATSRAAAMLDLITKVAHKTNMLALNASIEAVRVGEAGEGFMVVAEEVKALARSTRDAAHDITAQIREMEGANAAVANAFGDIIEVVNVLASQSATVANGMNEQAAAIGQVEDVIGTTTDELSAMVHSMDTADSAATAALNRSTEMMAASRHVSANVGALDTSVREFLGGMQNAQRRVA
jgi:methyl-accepting chemotaxis protein